MRLTEHVFSIGLARWGKSGTLPFILAARISAALTLIRRTANV